MQKINYQDISRAKAHKEKIDKAIKEETKDGKKPNPHRMNRLMESQYMPDIFDSAYPSYAKFRTPW